MRNLSLPRSASPWATILGGLAVILVVGCGGEGDAKLEVSGNVTFDGQPVNEGEILFSVEGFATEASRISDGHFSVRVPPGPAKVVVRAYRPMSKSDSASITATDVVMENYIPAKYNEKSELTTEVTSGMAPVNFDLSS